jgi:hypothetical protein
MSTLSLQERAVGAHLEGQVQQSGLLRDACLASSSIKNNPLQRGVAVAGHDTPIILATN